MFKFAKSRLDFYRIQKKKIIKKSAIHQDKKVAYRGKIRASQLLTKLISVTDS